MLKIILNKSISIVYFSFTSTTLFMSAKTSVPKKTTHTKTYFGFGKNDYPYLIGLTIIIFIICYLRSNFLEVPFDSLFSLAKKLAVSDNLFLLDDFVSIKTNFSSFPPDSLF